jgi:hypothetical protein
VLGKDIEADMRTRVLVVCSVLLFVVLASAGGAAYLYARAGRTPGEFIAYAKLRLQGHTALESVATPVLNGLRDWLGEPNESDLRSPFAVPALPTNPATLPSGAAPLATDSANSRVLHVGPRRSVTSIGQAAQLAKDGAVIEIDPGDYFADVAIWDRADITIRGLGNRVRLIAAGAAAEGKAIWIFRRGRARVENIEFIGARVSDRNGAGIRFEGGHLTVSRCVFFNNENGILTGDDAGARLEIENSEFGYNGAGDGYSHNLYVGRIGHLKVTGSYFHHANEGHLLKSRAQVNQIEYNRLTDESGGRASYELEFPNGGRAFVKGNILQQGRQTRNSVMLSFGAEGYTWPDNEIYLSHNTLVNDHPLGATFLRVAAGAKAAVTRNNLFVGVGRVYAVEGNDSAGDSQVDWSYFVQASREDYRLNEKGRTALKAVAVAVGSAELQIQAQYHHPAGWRALSKVPAYPGALQAEGP